MSMDARIWSGTCGHCGKKANFLARLPDTDIRACASCFGGTDRLSDTIRRPGLEDPVAVLRAAQFAADWNRHLDTRDRELLSASDWTLRKQNAFRQMVDIYAAVAAAIQRRHEYVGRWFYFEPTAGSGRLRYGDELLDGSPLIALRAFSQKQLRIDCLLCEHHPPFHEALRDSMGELDLHPEVRWKTRCTDSREILAGEAKPAGHYPHGLVYWDGLARDDYPADAISAWLRHNRMHDLLGMGSATAPKRMGRERLAALLTATASDSGRHGYVSDTHTAWGWVFALVTAWEPLADKLSRPDMHLHPFETKNGREILLELETTKAERQAEFNV